MNLTHITHTISNFFGAYAAQLPEFTAGQFMATWIFYSCFAIILFHKNPARVLRAILWLAAWILSTPLRPVGEDLVLLLGCFFSTEICFSICRRKLAKPSLQEGATS